MRSLLLLTAVIGGVLALRPGPIRAQQKTPEFLLDIWITDTTSTGEIIVNGKGIAGSDEKAIGYDTAATDGYDQVFGEVYDYPGTSDHGRRSLSFLYPPGTNVYGNSTEIDIRHKPVADSFAIQYTAVFSFENYPGSIFWDPSKIPSKVTAIWLQPRGYTDPVIDMKKTNTFTVPSVSQASLWGWTYTMTLFYNMQPHVLAGVNDAPSAATSLIRSLVAYPNPMVGEGALALSLGTSARLVITGYDVTGREVLRLAKSGIEGDNVIDLTGLTSAKGALLVRVDASTASGTESKSVVVMRR